MRRHFLAPLIAIYAVSFFLQAGENDLPEQARAMQRSDGSKIIYYLDQHHPEIPAQGLLVILQGSDCNSVTRIKSIQNDFRGVWPAADLLTVEKYGIDASLPYSTNAEREDCPQEYIKNDSPTLRAADILQVLQQLNYKQAVLLGGSEGALVTNLVASSADNISASIAFNGGGRWFIDDMLHSVKFQTSSTEEYNETAKGLTGFTEQVLASEPFELEMSGHGFAWWRNILEIDQLTILQKVDSPHLIVQSGNDQSVSPRTTQQMIQSLHQSGKNNISFSAYDELDHKFSDKHQVSKTSMVVSDMKAWLAPLVK